MFDDMEPTDYGIAIAIYLIILIAIWKFVGYGDSTDPIFVTALKKYKIIASVAMLPLSIIVVGLMKGR